MNTNIRYLFMLLLSVILPACSHNSTFSSQYTEKNHGNHVESIQYDAQNLTENEIFLYNIPQNRLGIYNKDTYTWRPLYDVDNLFQYVFGNDSEYVVSGHSIHNGFVLLQVSEDRKRMRKIFDLNNDDDCFFPLARNGQQFYYLLLQDEKNDEKKTRSIFTFDGHDKMQIILSTNDLITSGTILDHDLYYTAGDKKKDTYAAYAMDLRKEGEQPKLVKENLETRELYVIDDELYFSSRTQIFNDHQSFDKKFRNFVVNDFLIQMYSDSNYDMVCTVMDIKSKKILHTFKYPINFEVKDDTLFIYCEGQIYTMQI